MRIDDKELSHWGCCLEDADPLMLPHAVKERVTNNNAMRHGIEVDREHTRFDKKEITLVFSFYSGEDLYKRIDRFINDIYKGGSIVFWRHKRLVLDYLSSQSFNSLKGIGKLAVRFLVADAFEGEMLPDFNSDFSSDFKIVFQ